MLKRQNKNLLPSGVVDREALTRIVHNIKPRFTLSVSKGLRRLINSVVKLSLTGLLLLISFGYSPSLTLFSINSVVHAQELSSNISLSKQFSLPHIGYISTYFSAFHPGVDIAVDLGTPIHPIMVGVVESVNYDKTGYGNHVIIAHQDGLKSLYGHMGNIYVQKDQTVYLNTVLGDVGLTGQTSGPHTHLELTKNGAYINPTAILPQLSTLGTLIESSAVGGNTPPTKPEEKSTELRKTLKLDFS